MTGFLFLFMEDSMISNIDEHEMRVFEDLKMQSENLNDQFLFNISMFVIAFVVFLLLVFWPGTAHADQITEDQAIRTIIGEAANQGEKGMICVGEVLRRRGRTQGFYGLKAKHIDQQPSWVCEQAKRAWHKSAFTNYTLGSTHFENVHIFGSPSWSKRMKTVYRYRDHTFFVERSNNI